MSILYDSHSNLRREWNYIINGGFDFDQRHASLVASPITGVLTASNHQFDRWRYQRDGVGGTFSLYRGKFVLGQTDVPGEPKYYGHTETTAGTGGTVNQWIHPIENVRTLAGQYCTLSMWAKFDTPQNLTVELLQFFGTGGTPSASVLIETIVIPVGNSWQRITHTFKVPSISGKILGTNGDDALYLMLPLPVNTTLSFDMASVSVIAGQHPINYHEVIRPEGVEFNLCQRYHEESYLPEVKPGTATTNGMVFMRSSFQQFVEGNVLLVPKRALPVITFYNPITGATGTWRDINLSSDFAINVAASSTGYNSFGFEGIAPGVNNRIKGHWVADAEL